MTEYAYSRKEPCISSTTSMSRIFSSYESSGGGVFVLRRAIAAAAPSQSLPGHERDLTRTIVDRATDNADRDPSVRARRGTFRCPYGDARSEREPAPSGRESRCGRTRCGNFARGPRACIQWQDRQEFCSFPRSKG